MPIDLHIDLGNHCNLACKMCWPGASTAIATQYVKWGMPAEQYLGVDWTKDPEVWARFLDELVAIPKLKNIHFMGGETLLSPRLEQLVDHMIAHKRFDVNFSFVTNGTVYKPKLIEKLKQFPRVGIEISIETTTEHNNYIRQGSKVDDVINNIKKYKQLCSGSDVSVTLRPAISALSIGYYHTLLKFCLEEQLLIKSLIVTTPDYLDPQLLPWNVREQYVTHYTKLLDELEDIDITFDYNESDTSNYKKVIKQQVNQVLNLLDAPEYSAGLTEMTKWCERWDQVYGFELLTLYPEFAGYI
jgi:sulfatase maturation enzyme AslB (radical SAM superfamily)